MLDEADREYNWFSDQLGLLGSNPKPGALPGCATPRLIQLGAQSRIYRKSQAAFRSGYGATRLSVLYSHVVEPSRLLRVVA